MNTKIIKLEKKQLQQWLKIMDQEVALYQEKVQKSLEVFLETFFDNRYTLVPDHFYSVMSSRNIHQHFLNKYVESVLSAQDDFKEEGRILAVSKLQNPVSGFDIVETGQPYLNNPETEKVAHISYSFAGRDSRPMTNSVKDHLIKKFDMIFCFGSPEERIESIPLKRDVFIKNLAPHYFNDQMVGLKIDFVVDNKDYQVELRVHPITETLGSLDRTLLQD